MGNTPKNMSKSNKAGRASRSDQKNVRVTKKLEAVSRQDAANYINEMAFEMKSMAEKAKLSFLSYLLDLVIEESASHRRGRLLHRVAENNGGH